MKELKVRLLDVVPWTHGYAHSWALKWLLEEWPDARARLMATFVPGIPGPWAAVEVFPEYKVPGRRADLRAEATNDAGETASVLVETKVNDALTESQINAYHAEEPDAVVLYVPGLTGLLMQHHPMAERVVWLNGRRLIEALDDIELPWIVRSYLEDVGAEAADMEAACRAVLGDGDMPTPRELSMVRQEDLEAVAWVNETAAELARRGQPPVYPRNTAHDWGVYWPGMAESPAGMNGARAYVDLVAAHGGGEYAVCIKVGDGEIEDRRRLQALARQHEPGEHWRASALGRGANFRIWTYDAGDCTPDQTADVAVAAQHYIAGLAAVANAHG